MTTALTKEELKTFKENMRIEIPKALERQGYKGEELKRKSRIYLARMDSPDYKEEVERTAIEGKESEEKLQKDTMRQFERSTRQIIREEGIPKEELEQRQLREFVQDLGKETIRHRKRHSLYIKKEPKEKLIQEDKL